MGANSHERVVDLWWPASTYSVSTGKKIAMHDYTWGGVRYVDEMVTKTTRRKRRTPEEAWQAVYDEEGYEDGHSYSGGFGSKGGMIVLARNEKVDRYLGELGTLMYYIEGFDGGLPAALKMPRDKVYCGCINGTVLKDPNGPWSGERITCPACNGTLKRARTDEEKAALRKRINARKKLIALLGEDTLRRIHAVYDDKWGPAAAVVGKDFVWFGGYCPS